MIMPRTPASHARRAATALSTLVLGATTAFSPMAVAAIGSVALSGCKGDPEENFRLWSNNEAGWDEMTAYVADKGNDLKLRERALEVLIDEGGQPSQAMRVVGKAPDKVEVLLALQPFLMKMLENPNQKKQDHAKRVLMDMIPLLPEDKKLATRKAIARWAFGDLSPEDSAQRIVEKLGQRLRPEEIEALGEEGLPGAEIMLSKGIARDGIMGVLQSMHTPGANKAMINGLRRYHKIKNVKITEQDLAAVQKTDSLEGFLYFVELYQRLSPSKHPDDKQASSLAIAAATEWADKPDNQAKIKGNWAAVKPTMDGLLMGPSAEDRWWAAQLLVKYQGVDGLKEVLAKLPDDKNYGQEEFAGTHDVKKEITDFCSEDVKALGADKVRPVLETSLGSLRLIERIYAVRCLIALGDDNSLGVLKAYNKKDLAIVDPVVVPQTAEKVTVADLAQAGVEIVEFGRATDKLAAEGKIDAATAKWRKYFAEHSFERKGKALVKFAEENADEKVAKDKAKAAKK
jgi:hypothetical protein